MPHHKNKKPLSSFSEPHLTEDTLPLSFFEEIQKDDKSKTKSTTKKHKNPHKKPTPLKIKDGNDDNCELPAQPIFALPSESLAEKQESFFNELESDGFLINKKGKKVIKRGSKVATEENAKFADLTEEEKVDMNRVSQSRYLGRKNWKNWSKDVKSLRKRFGFSWQRVLRQVTIYLIIVIIFGLVSFTGAMAFAIDMWRNTETFAEISRTPAQNSVVYARDGKTKLFEYFDEEKRELIDGKKIPQIMKSAVLALEDENFYENQENENAKGIPWTNIAGAMSRCLISGGDECRGASGISQQLVKNASGDSTRDVDRKIRELFRAMKLNEEVDNPEEIIEAYLNWVPFGRNAYGIQQASQSYFGRPIDATDQNGEYLLTPVEACYMSAIINRPGYYQAGINTLPQANAAVIEARVQNLDDSGGGAVAENKETNQKIIPQESLDLENRKNICLQKLVDNEFRDYQRDSNNKIMRNDNGRPILEPKTLLTQEMADQMANTTVIVTGDEAKAVEARRNGQVAFVDNIVDDPYPHFREFVTKEIEKVVSTENLYSQGYEIVTTLDPELQDQLTDLVRGREDFIKQYEANNASAVVLDGPTGEILAMVGSLGYTREDIDGKVNIATSPQQPGSSIKPYVYMNAFDNGFNPGTIVTDVQTTWPGNYTPKNFSGTFNGPVTLRRALQGSLNIPAVKTMFLGQPGANPRDERGALDDFFNFTDDLGLEFPCFGGARNEGVFKVNNQDFQFADKREDCKISTETGITQEHVDQAYRGRCYLATALGGCELTMISHATAFNTILQEGNKFTATPFQKITSRVTDQDVYAKRQAGEVVNLNGQPLPIPYPTKILDIENPDDRERILLARQMTNVMSDYEARIPEFGSLRRTLELNNYGTRVAAKTGTSNGPKDFWTIGGSRYYTVAVWVGRTDNEDMARSASSTRTAAPIWKDIMELLHESKEPIPFNYDGLERGWVPGGGGTRNEEGEIEGGIRGSSELLTQKQLQQNRGGVVALNTPEDIEDLKKKDIFQNRTALLTASYFVNKSDGKLFVEGQNLDEDKEEVQCGILIGEFPQEPNWDQPVRDWANRFGPKCEMPDPSDQDSIELSSPPEINTNLQTGSTTSASQIQVSVNFVNPSDRNVANIEILQNGIPMAIDYAGGNTATADLIEGGPYNFTVKVTDNLDQTFQNIISNVTVDFGNPTSPTPISLTGDDLSEINCIPNPVTAGQQTLCSFTILDEDKTFTQISLKAGQETVLCTIASPAVNCNLSPTAIGVFSLEVIIDGVSYPMTQGLEVI